MVKKDKASEKVESKAEKAAEREFKYGVEDIAESLGIKPASVRVQLRNKGIDKAGKSYGWNSKTDLKEVIDQLQAAKPAEDEKPAKKAKKDAAPSQAAKPAKKAKKVAEEEDDD
jgi:hypothetical protein